MLQRADLFRLVAGLVADELGVQRARPIETATQLAWSEQTRLDDEASESGSLAFDSLARIDVSGRLNNFFHLHETGVEDYLLTQKTLGGLVDVIAAAQKLKAERLTFQTSGSSGLPKPCTHEIALLLEEARHLAALLPRTRRIVSLVPPHHIYGCLFTVLLPLQMGADVVDARAWGPSRLARELGDGDALIASPHLWSYLVRSLPGFASGVTGVTSTAPMPDALKADLRSRGLSRLLEVYGSSETAGIGARGFSDSHFELFPHWTRAGDSLVRSLPGGGVAEPAPLADLLEWSAERSFRVVGRRDGAVQVGGVNVFPARVAEIINSHELVAECAVRVAELGGDAARTRLKAFVVPKDLSIAHDEVLKAVEGHVAGLLQPLERPTIWQAGPALPRNDMGKLTDW
jgi:4-coumarate--CoA ligase (photoactive yellow protein activation family)